MQLFTCDWTIFIRMFRCVFIARQTRLNHFQLIDAVILKTFGWFYRLDFACIKKLNQFKFQEKNHSKFQCKINFLHSFKIDLRENDAMTLCTESLISCDNWAKFLYSAAMIFDRMIDNGFVQIFLSIAWNWNDKKYAILNFVSESICNKKA